MELLLQRKYHNDAYTIGKLYHDMHYVCDTLEPSTHGLTGAHWTVPKIRLAKEHFGSVAIPPGRYPLLITKSPRFGRWLPLLLGVKGFAGVRIHAGNKPSDTRGCILPGYNRRKGYVLQSTTCLNTIVGLLADCFARGGRAWIRVE